MQYRENRPVTSRIQEAEALPRPSQRSSLRLAVAYNCHHKEIRIVESRAEDVSQHVAQLPTFGYGPWRLDAHMAGNASGSRKLPEEQTHACGSPGDLRVNLGIGAFEIDAGYQRRPPVAGSSEIDDVGIM